MSGVQIEAKHHPPLSICTKHTCTPKRLRAALLNAIHYFFILQFTLYTDHHLSSKTNLFPRAESLTSQVVESRPIFPDSTVLSYQESTAVVETCLSCCLSLLGQETQYMSGRGHITIFELPFKTDMICINYVILK